MKKTIWIVVAVIIIILVIVLINSTNNVSGNTIKVGWISDLSGSTKKYGAYEAGKLAQEEINAAGGINGKMLEIIYEDGKCNSKDATNAAQKLIAIDKVRVIIGGHCTPESAAIAPVAETNKVVMLAAITSSPLLSGRSPYFFRTTSVSTLQAPILGTIAKNNLKVKKLAVMFEQTDYARPVAEAMKAEFEKLGGSVPVYESFAPDQNDFKTVLAKVKGSGVDAVFISNQRPDAGINILKQMSELGIKVKILGNDIMATDAVVKAVPQLTEGMIYAAPRYDVSANAKTQKFVTDFTAKYGYKPPFGIFTAESYDGVYIIAGAIGTYGNDAEKIREYLSHLQDYKGASGTVSINEKHDGVREYIPMIIKGGQPSEYSN